MDALTEKPWRRPGSDLSDYFNYGFDEVSWEAYCYRRRDLGEMANHLKGAVTNFAGMPEDQITALPPEVRAMVMTGATSLMSSGPMPHGGPQMMGVGVGGPGPMMHPHPHEMGMMGVMNGSEMQQAASMMQGSVPEGDVMGMQGMQQEGFQQNVPGPGQMMGMSQEYAMQDPSALGMYPQNMDGGGTPGQVQPQGPAQGPVPGPSPVAGSGPTGPAATRGSGPSQGGFRGRGVGSPAMGMRGRGGFGGRGRGRGAMFVPDGAPPPIPVRPASPLPPGVPTGPRNQNRYKDRDGNAPAVDGLDYGGTQGGSLESDDRGNARKRRGSPGQDETRSSKRR
ncbi:Fip1 motif-domain-containing protein [Gautieria morchelliformis]|nr:Fip1 motif-domain-containing protein [Gautieria morchelliformis]